MNHYSLLDYTYSLPESLIAQEAVHPHHNAKMMVLERLSEDIQDEWTFKTLEQILTPNDVLFLNNSRVVRSRIPLSQVQYTTKMGHTWMIENGEIFFLRNCDNGEFEALVRPGNKFKKGTNILFSHDIQMTVTDITPTGRKIRLHQGNIYQVLEQYGRLPLPPYIEYDATKEEDYQTSFAEKDGSVAAPTASLHFTQELLENIQAKKEYVTLHVWLGTFKWIDTQDIREYAIHKEVIEVPKNIFTKIATLKSEEKYIIAVGTTVCRTLESLPYLWKKLSDEIKNTYTPETQDFWNIKTENILSGSIISNIILDSETILCETEIYITPGYHFLVIDDLITNFHLPQSSLLVLVSAFLWFLPTMKIYQYAIENRYRFFSFWDGMYIRKPRNTLQVPHQYI